MSTALTPVQQKRQTYLENGFLLEKSFFTRDEAEDVREEAKAIFNIQLERHGLGLNDLNDDSAFETQLRTLFKVDYDAFLGAARLVQHGIKLHQMSINQKVLARLEELRLTFPVLCIEPVIYFNSPHLAAVESHYKTPAHQDWRGMQGSLDSMVVWVALVGIDKALGTIEVVPKSHRLGLLKTEEDAWFRHVADDGIREEDYQSVEVKAGDTLFFSSLLVHRSGNNITDKIRWSVHFRYNNAMEETFGQRKFPHPYTLKPYQELLSENFPTKTDIEKIFER